MDTPELRRKSEGFVTECIDVIECLWKHGEFRQDCRVLRLDIHNFMALHQLYYKAVHEYTRSRTMAPRMLEEVNKAADRHLLAIAKAGNFIREADFKSYLEQQQRTFLRASWYINFALKRLNRALYEIDDRKFRTVYQSLDFKFKTVFLPEAARNARITTFELLYLQPSHNLDKESFALLRQLIQPITPQSKQTHKRAVYLKTSPIGRSDFRSEHQETPSLTLSRAYERCRPFFRFNAVEHWAVLIESEETSKIDTYEIQVIGNGVHPQIRQRGPMEALSHLKVIGYTTLTDDDVLKYATHVRQAMENEYHVLKNNCQRFCAQLYNCICVPSSGLDLVLRRAYLPLQSRDEISHLLLISLLAQAEEFDDFRPTFLAKPLPMTLSVLSARLLVVLAVYVVIYAKRRLPTPEYLCLLAALVLGVSHTDIMSLQNFTLLFQDRDVRSDARELLEAVYEDVPPLDRHHLLELQSQTDAARIPGSTRSIAIPSLLASQGDSVGLIADITRRFFSQEPWPGRG